MKQVLFIFALVGFFFGDVIFAQHTPTEKLFEIRGFVKNQDQIQLAGLNLFFEGSESKNVITNENGAFITKLPVGKYKVTTNEAVSKSFVAFIETFDNNLNATDFDLIIETEKFCCGQMTGGGITEVVKYFAPPFPVAARAVRATGEVIVTVKIGKDGKVISSKAEIGHPLLRRASELAAKEWIFSIDESISERDGKIVFAYIDGEKKKSNIFIKPNRLEIFAQTIIEAINTH